MKRILIFLSVIAMNTFSQGQKYTTDTIETDEGKLTIYLLGHGTLMFNFKGLNIHIDPVRDFADYTVLPKADIILITHHHPDHLDKTALSLIEKPETKYIVTPTVFNEIKKGFIMNNGEKRTVDGIQVEAVPAYNVTKDRDKFHPRGRDNGYALTFGNKRVYIAGDTENTPEMEALKNISIAFLPMNQPYTMTPDQVADVARKFTPEILYPYHYGNTDVSILKELLKNQPDIEVRIRDMK